MNNEYKKNVHPGGVITFVITDPSPFYFMQEPPSHRTVSIDISDEIVKKLGIKQTGTDCGRPVFEYISQIFHDDAHD